MLAKWAACPPSCSNVSRAVLPLPTCGKNRFNQMLRGFLLDGRHGVTPDCAARVTNSGYTTQRWTVLLLLHLLKAAWLCTGMEIEAIQRVFLAEPVTAHLVGRCQTGEVGGGGNPLAIGVTPSGLRRKKKTQSVLYTIQKQPPHTDIVLRIESGCYRTGCRHLWTCSAAVQAHSQQSKA